MRQKIKLFVTLLLLCLSTTAWAQYTYSLTLDPNYEGAESVSIPVEYGVSGYQYKLSNFVPTSSFGSDFIRDGHSIVGWALSPTEPIKYAPNATVTMTGSLTLYAVWDHGLLYTITSESHKTVELTGYLGNKPTGVLEIPASVTLSGNVYAVTSIGNDAFKNCDGIITVTFAAGSQLTSIGDYAFYDCEGLTSITIPASVTTIGKSAFEYCTQLGTVTFAVGSQLTSIGNNAFRGCYGLTTVTIPASVTSIGDKAFDTCFNLTTVTIQGNPAIGDGAFPACATVMMNLTANEGATDEYWMTFYNKNYNFQADANTQIFKASLSGTTLALTELTTDKIVNADKPVILKSTSGPISLTLVSSGGSNNFDGNNLQGVSDAAGKSGSTNDIYVLNKKTAGVGFYKLATDKTLGVGKAYLQTTSSSNFFGMEEETTGVKSIDNGKLIIDNYYDLSGRKVEKPTKGLYIVNGKKIVFNR